MYSRKKDRGERADLGDVMLAGSHREGLSSEVV
jgi:hypothetical protein